jgi:hypothetical protein
VENLATASIEQPEVNAGVIRRRMLGVKRTWASGNSSPYLFFTAFRLAQRFFWAAEIKARAAALMVRFFGAGEAFDVGVFVPRMLSSSLCNFTIRSLRVAAFRN